jgi:hypothetical protein
MTGRSTTFDNYSWTPLAILSRPAAAHNVRSAVRPSATGAAPQSYLAMTAENSALRSRSGMTRRNVGGTESGRSSLQEGAIRWGEICRYVSARQSEKSARNHHCAGPIVRVRRRSTAGSGSPDSSPWLRGFPHHLLISLLASFFPAVSCRDAPLNLPISSVDAYLRYQRTESTVHGARNSTMNKKAIS